MSDSIETKFQKNFQKYCPGLLTPSSGSGRFNIWVALSGGVDSCVLLDLSTRLLEHCSIQVIHVNHGLLSEASEWAKWTEQLAHQYRVGHHLVAVDVKGTAAQLRLGLEAAARHLRYQAFESVITHHRPHPNESVFSDVLLLGHHEQDQAETVLLRLLRGTGLTGLSGIPMQRPFFKTNNVRAEIFRPLLNSSKSEILQYATTRKLEFVIDPSNLNNHFRRNFLRNTIFPLFETHWPGASKRMANLAQELQDKPPDCPLADLDSFLKEPILSFELLRAQAPPMQKNILRAWLKRHTLQYPSRALTQRLIDVLNLNPLNTMRTDQNWQEQLPEGMIKLYRNQFYWLSQKKLSLIKQYENLGPLFVHRGQSVCVPTFAGKIELTWELIVQSLRVGISKKASLDHLTVKFHHCGDTAKKRMQEAGVPPWERVLYPQLFEANQWLGHLKIDHSSLSVVPLSNTD